MLEEILKTLKELVANNKQVDFFVDDIRIDNGVVRYTFDGLMYCVLRPAGPTENNEIDTYNDVSNEEIASGCFQYRAGSFKTIDEALAELIEVCADV